MLSQCFSHSIPISLGIFSQMPYVLGVFKPLSLDMIPLVLCQLCIVLNILPTNHLVRLRVDVYSRRGSGEELGVDELPPHLCDDVLLSENMMPEPHGDT